MILYYSNDLNKIEKIIDNLDLQVSRKAGFVTALYKDLKLGFMFITNLEDLEKFSKWEEQVGVFYVDSESDLTFKAASKIDYDELQLVRPTDEL